MVVFLSLHVLELVHPSLRVALPHLPQGLVLIPALLDVLLVYPIHGRLYRVVARLRQVLLQTLELTLEALVSLGEGDAVVHGIVDVVRVKPETQNTTCKLNYQNHVGVYKNKPCW